MKEIVQALDLLPPDDDKSTPKDINDRLNGLVARSACYLKIGKNDLSLQDAEESLKSNKEFTKVSCFLCFLIIRLICRVYIKKLKHFMPWVNSN
jgi:hypothetical protein